MEKKYCVLFQKLSDEEAVFKESMARLGVTSDVVDEMIKKAPIILKGDMKLGIARRYAEAIQEAGGRVVIQEDGRFEGPSLARHSFPVPPLERFTMCPECGLKQPKKDVCAKCGHKFKQKEATPRY